MRIASRLWLTLAVFGTFARHVDAQQQSPPQPAWRPAAACGPVIPNPRDQLPFTNESMTNLNPALPTLFITGDSTAATGNPTTRGWAALLVDYFDPSKVNLVNQAQGGARFNHVGIQTHQNDLDQTPPERYPGPAL